MTLRDLQPEAMARLEAALARADDAVDPRLLAVARSCIECHVAGAPTPLPSARPDEAAVQEVVEQMLMDVSGLDDQAVRRAADLLPDGELANLVMASYVNEAAARLRVASDRLLGGMG